jgi:hypothetical protein
MQHNSMPAGKREHLPPTPHQLVPRIVLLLALIALCMATQRSGTSRPAMTPAAAEAR